MPFACLFGFFYSLCRALAYLPEILGSFLSRSGATREDVGNYGGLKLGKKVIHKR